MSKPMGLPPVTPIPWRDVMKVTPRHLDCKTEHIDASPRDSASNAPTHMWSE